MATAAANGQKNGEESVEIEMAVQQIEQKELEEVSLLHHFIA